MMDGPRLVPFPSDAIRAGERQEDYLLRCAVRLLEAGFAGDVLLAMLSSVADSLPNRSVSDSALRRVAEAAAKFVDPALADPFANPADLSLWREAAAAPWIVPGFLQRGALTLLSARGGTGKSLVTLALAVKVAAGESGRFLEFVLPGEVTPVAILDAECGSLRVRRRLRALVMGGELSAESVDRALANLYLFPAESFVRRSGVLGRLDELAGRLPDVRVLVVDPLRSFVPDTVEDENQNLSLGRVLDGLVALAKREDVAVLVSDHDSKAGSPARGASAKRDAAEILWHFTAPTESDPAYVEARPDKLRDPGGPSRFAFRLVTGELSSDGIYPASFEAAELRAAPGRPGDPLAAAIAETVQRVHASTGAGVSIRTLVKETGAKQTTVYEKTKRLVNDGLLYQPAERGSFYPPAARPDDLEGEGE